MNELPSEKHSSVIERTRVPLNLRRGSFLLRKIDGVLGKTNLFARVLSGVFQRQADWVMVDGFEMKQQCHTHWCWAAVGEAVSRCYDPAAGFTQREIAKLMFDQEYPNEKYDAPCCTDPTSAAEENLPYNKNQSLQSVLIAIKCYGHSGEKEKPAAPMDVRDWIDGDEHGRRAVCIRIRWKKSGGTHFLAIDGYLPNPTPNLTLFHIWDPLGGASLQIPYDILAAHYTKSEGSWKDTLYTQRLKKAH
jgi:hypothetical protein